VLNDTWCISDNVTSTTGGGVVSDYGRVRVSRLVVEGTKFNKVRYICQPLYSRYKYQAFSGDYFFSARVHPMAINHGTVQFYVFNLVVCITYLGVTRIRNILGRTGPDYQRLKYGVFLRTTTYSSARHTVPFWGSPPLFLTK
jgi:hypothetical protein